MALVRKDSWAGALQQEDLAKIYETWSRFHGLWNEFAEWIEQTFPDARKPSRTALYDAVRAPSEECKKGGCLYQAWIAVRSQSIRSAGEQMAEWAKSAKIDNATLIEGLKNLGCNALSTGDQETGLDLLNDFRETARLMLDQQKQELNARAQETKEEQLKLARDKFEAAERRLNAAKDTVSDVKLTPEEKIRELDKLFGR